MSECISSEPVSIGVCGTGGWTGPKPGDPDNNIVLAAVAKAGGIEVSWSYPLVNPHAVAHTRLYRSTTNSFSTATQRAVVDGSYFFDRIEGSGTTYYYWIRVVSVNGTVGDPVGPASATLTGELAHLKDLLYGEIDEGVLAQALKGEIANITTLGQGLLQEIQDRIAAGDLLGVLFEQVSSDVSTAFTFIEERLDTLVSADSALIEQFQLLAAMVNENGALILSEQNLRVDADQALANTMDYLYAQMGDQLQAAVQSEQNARVTADQALANQINTTQTTLNGNIASVQTSLQSNINTVNGKVTEIGALYTAKVDVNGLVGGFGVYNNGQFVDAGFDVDRFWIGRAGANKVKPFLIQDGVVYINEARIGTATIGTLKIANEAVTAPRMSSAPGPFTGTTTWTTRASVIAAEDTTSCLLICKCKLTVSSSPGFGSEVRVRLLSPNGVVLDTTSISIFASIDDSYGSAEVREVVLMGIHAGPGTYVLQIYGIGDTGLSRTVSEIKLAAFAMKR